jgi:peptidoglycan/xylan/chitin deacetylase (PgdA/CDA1 family)
MRFPRRIKTSLRSLGSIVSIAVARNAEVLLRYSARRAGIALVYHKVGCTQGEPGREILAPHGLELFEAQLRHLEARYRVVDAEDLLDAARHRKRGEPFPVAITFDDDLPSHASVAMLALQRAGVRATFFLSGASLERPFAFWWERLQRAMDQGGGDIAGLVGVDLPPGMPGAIHELGRAIEEMPPEQRDSVAAKLGQRLGPDPTTSGMRADDVRALAEAGFRIGFHTYRHDTLPALDDAALSQAMRAGRAELEAVVRSRLGVIAYPHGRADLRVAAAARAAGFDYGFTGREESVVHDSDPLFLGRLGPSYQSVGRFALQLVLTLARKPPR